MSAEYRTAIYECSNYDQDVRDGCHGEALARLADEFDDELASILTLSSSVV